jgi:hypothetical protein
METGSGGVGWGHPRLGRPRGLPTGDKVAARTGCTRALLRPPHALVYWVFLASERADAVWQGSLEGVQRELYFTWQAQMAGVVEVWCGRVVRVGRTTRVRYRGAVC